MSRTMMFLRERIRGFRRSESGHIAIIFGLSAVALILAAGAGIDLSRAYQARQKLSEVATLTCQYASRPSVIKMASANYTAPSGGPTYSSAVTGYLNTALAGQKVLWTQTNATPFTYTVNGTADVSVAANVPTTLMKVAGLTQVHVAASSHCYDNPSSVPENTTDNEIIQEGFEATDGTSYTFYQIPGRSYIAATNTFTPTAVYVGSTGSSWYAMGYCLETDAAGVIQATVPEGARSAELDCDNGSNSAGNSSISTRTYLAPGNYELRYNYSSRVSYPNYDPTYLCASTASDLSWANDTNSSGGPVANALRSNQMNVYLDIDSTGAPPTHTTIGGLQTLAGSNLIDMCVYSKSWVERSVRIFVTSAGYYWLSFAADGQNDSYGAQLDDIRLCTETCNDTLQDNFPSTWLAADNGGVNKVLFRDTLESPTYSPAYTNAGYAAANMNNDTGTSGTASSGWPTQTATAWATSPYNQIEMILSGSTQGSQSLEMDGSKGGSLLTSNRTVSRYFVLDPGYYKLDYYYISGALFPSLSGVTCTTAPSTSSALSSYPNSATASANVRYPPATYTLAKDTNIVAVFMANGVSVSTPVTGNAANSATSYNNPDGTTTTTATNSPTALSFSNYDTTQVNPVLDICGYANAWQSRTANFTIQKPGKYWLFFTGLGSDDAIGGTIDDIRVTALGSPYLASPPTGGVAIPVPTPAVGAQRSFTGFYIIANPLTPPAALQ